MATLAMTQRAMTRILAAAKKADANECMGLLAGPRGLPLVTAARLLPATASAAHATADPVAIKQCAEALLARRLVPKGLFHSHGHLHVFHSATDHATLNRLLPAMAPWNFQRPGAAIRAPTVIAPDAAILPTADGQVMRFSLVGAAIPGIDAHQRAAWDSITTSFGAAEHAPQARLEATHLHLEGSRVVVSLGIPEGASVSCQQEDNAPFRCAYLYSLVVNSAGERCAECLIIRDIEGHSLIQQEPCDIDLSEDSDGTL